MGDYGKLIRAIRLIIVHLMMEKMEINLRFKTKSRVFKSVY